MEPVICAVRKHVWYYYTEGNFNGGELWWRIAREMAFGEIHFGEFTQLL